MLINYFEDKIFIIVEDKSGYYLHVININDDGTLISAADHHCEDLNMAFFTGKTIYKLPKETWFKLTG